MFRQLILIAASAGALSGCDLARWATMGRAEKVNAAVPLPEQLQVTQASLFTALGDDKSVEPVKRQWQQLLDVRALTCASAAKVGRFDSPADVKKQLPDTTCFRDQDAELSDWVGLRRVMLAVRQPALVPAAALPGRVIIPNPSDAPAEMTVAAAANVGVIKSSRNTFTSVALPAGKVIRAFGANEQNVRPMSLSPNGRVLALAVPNESLRFFDTESGNLLWSTARYSTLIAWLPEVESVLLAQKGNATPTLMDLRNGTAAPYPASTMRISWVVPLPGTPARSVAGDSGNATLVEHSRGADGSVAVNAVKQMRLPPHGSGMEPLVMMGGRRLVILGYREVAWMDLETGAQGGWQLSLIGGRGFAKMSETTLLFDAEALDTPHRSWLLDVEKETAVAVKETHPGEGQLQRLGARDGYLRRGYQGMVAGTVLTTEGEPQPVEKMIADKLLAQQLQRVEAMTTAQAAAAAPFAPPPPAPGQSTLIPGIPANAHVSAIGVYESALQDKSRGRRAPGPVRVVIAPSSTPLVLVLSSYESIQWNIQNQGRPIAAILVSGYEASTVQGVSGKTIVIGRQYAHKMDGPEYLALRQQVARYVSNPIRLFQGTYKGTEFTVPAM